MQIHFIVPIAYILVVLAVFVYYQTEQYTGNGFSSKRKKEITDFSKCRSACPSPLVFTLQLGGKAGEFAKQWVEQCAEPMIRPGLYYTVTLWPERIAESVRLTFFSRVFNRFNTEQYTPWSINLKPLFHWRGWRGEGDNYGSPVNVQSNQFYNQF